MTVKIRTIDIVAVEEIINDNFSVDDCALDSLKTNLLEMTAFQWSLLKHVKRFSLQSLQLCSITHPWRL